MSEHREVLVEYLRTVSDNRGAPFVKCGFIELWSREPDENDRFSVLVDGYLERWPLDRIKAAIAAGIRIEEREAAA